MMTLARVSLPGGGRHWCLVAGRAEDVRAVLDVRFEEFDADSKSSDLFLDADQRVLLKAPRFRSRLVENAAKLVGLAPSSKEARGARILNRLGLRTRPTFASALPLNPFGPYRSFLYCRFLADAVPLNSYLRQNPDAPERRNLLDTVAEQMARMINNGVAFRDFYFGNLLLSSSGDLYWIDTEVRKYLLRKGRARARFLERLPRVQMRFLKHGGREDEWSRFLAILIGERPDRQGGTC